ncbi:MAG TPA: DUF6090 family protein [Chryseosolibacter sp.]|nr:DUF6090 family protein [Chryseosolibacter sp.]
MKKLKDYFVELSLIVLGVLIAISVDDYRERSKTRAMVHSYLLVLKKDLIENLKLLDEEIFYDSIVLNRLGILRDKMNAQNYDGLDSLTLYLTEHSSFSINDTGFRMIVESGNSHALKTENLAQLTNLFGATMTDLKFYQDIDYDNLNRGRSFFEKYYPNVSEHFRQANSSISTELLHAVMCRLISMELEREQKKKVKQKILQVLAYVDHEV